MKKVKFIIATLFVVAIGAGIFWACEKIVGVQEESNQENKLMHKDMYNPDEGNPCLKIYRGTNLWENCKHDYTCGPCAGLCFRSGVTLGNETMSYDQNTEGLIMIEEILSNSIKIKILSQGLTTDDGYTGFDEDYTLGNDIASIFGYNSINLHSGIYEVDFSNSIYGEVYITATFIP